MRVRLPKLPEIACIPLHPVEMGRVAIIDADDLWDLPEVNWLLNGTTGYVSANVEGKSVYLHRVVAKTPNGFTTDHINGDKLDNRKANLRVCTARQNTQNRRKVRRNNAGDTPNSRYKGVILGRRHVNWIALIKTNGRTRTLGTYTTEADAARAYDDAARKHFGEFARLNFPNAGEQAA